MATLLATCSGGDTAAQGIDSYLAAVKWFPVLHVVKACEEIRDTWQSEYGAPTPGVIAAKAKSLARLAEQRTDDLRWREGMAEMKRDAMTGQNAAELLRLRERDPLPEGPVERRIEERIRAGMERIAN